MPETMTLKDGALVILFSERDFEEQVDKYMGPEAARYFRTLMDELEEYREGCGYDEQETR